MNNYVICNLNSTIYLNPNNGKIIALKRKNEEERIEILKDENINELLREELESYDIKQNDIELIIVNITNKCNLSCSYCYRGNLITETINVDNIILFLNKFPVKKEITILFQGGEPLVEFSKIKKIIDELGNRFRYAIQTNGVLLSDEIVQYCKENNVRISVSIDGIDYDDNKMRFHNNIKEYYLMKDNIKKYSKDINQGAIAVINSNNVDKMLSIATFFTKNGIKLFSFNPIWPIGRGGKYQKESICAENDQLVDNMLEVMEFLYKYNLKNRNKQVFEKNTYLLWQRIFLRKFDNYMCAQNPCGAGNRTLVIDVDGRIYPCTYFIEHEYLLGHVLEYETLNAKHISIRKEKLGQEECTECMYRLFCGGGCTGAVKMFGYNTYCGYFKKLIPKLIDWQVNKFEENIITNFKSKVS